MNADLDPTGDAERAATIEARDGEHSAPSKRPPRWVLTLVLGLILVTYLGNWLATLTMAGIMKQHPALLILLNPMTRNLALVADRVDPVVFYGIAIPRRMLPHVLWFLIGRWYGQRGINWVVKRSPDIGVMINWIEARFPRFGWLICFLYPHPAVCVIAGASKMRFKPFFVFTLVGVIFFAILGTVIGFTFSSYIHQFVDFGDRYKWQFIAVTFVLMALSFYLSQEEDRSKFKSIEQMESELEGTTDSPRRADATPDGNENGDGMSGDDDGKR